MMMRRLGTAALLVFSLSLGSQPVNATSGGGTNIGVFTTGAANDTGSREWIALTGTDGFLSGWPRHTSIAFIVVYAPGADDGHLILRELESSGGRRSLLLSAPSTLVEKTRRVTLYVKHHSENLILLERTKTNWTPRSPQPIRIAVGGGDGATQEDLLAYSVAEFGLYWLVEESEESGVYVSSIIAQDTSASQLLGGGISRSVLPWGWSVLLLAVGWSMSRLIHRISR
jgi:hypothetical protein